MDKGKRPNVSHKKNVVNNDKTDANDPVKDFERWKKKFGKKNTRVKQMKGQNHKPDWKAEKESIERLVSKYNEINAKDVLKFSDFPLSNNTLRGLMKSQYRQPTEIQKQTIGFALQGKDVLGAAKTGSGKTLAFLIPILECLYRQQWSSLDGLGALVISPTRELAYQTYEVLRKVGMNHEFSAGLVIGGKDLKSEMENILRTNIIICTPGRLLQHMDETVAFHASDLQILVLDEADRILDMGFSETINAIVENLPTTRQTLLFSATQTKSVKDLARLSLKDPEYVWVHENAKFSTPATLEQNYVVCELHHKVNMLFSFIRSHLQKKVIVFFACCKEVQYLYRVFCRLRPGTSLLALHGKQQQMKRVEVYNDFIKKKNAVLFATDIAARGLDFPAVNWVLQFDCPEDANTYIHRVGRTARYKEGGEALLVLLPSEEKGMVAQLQEKKVPINRIQVNPDKLRCVQQKLQAFLAQETEQKERAQRCFQSYLRSVYLMKNKDVFDVFRLNLQEYAASLGLAVAPRVRFLNKAQNQKVDPGQVSHLEVRAQSDEEEEELKSFKAQLRGQGPSAEAPSSQSSGDDDDEEEGEEEEEKLQPKFQFVGANEEEDEDLKDLDLLTVVRKNVFSQEQEVQNEESNIEAKKKPKVLTKYTEAKKLLKKNFKVNTKVVFTEDGQMVQQWPPLQRAVEPVPEPEADEDNMPGINVDKARERLQREDQEFDKLEYRRRIKEKHKERRLKGKAAQKGSGKQPSEELSETDEEEDEVVAYVEVKDGEQFDPSTLPDPDKLRQDSEEDDDQNSPFAGKRKRSHSDSSSSSSEEEEKAVGGRKRPRTPAASKPLDTGLSLAEDEELALHLLGNQS
ncbi:hypothetical protein UPYG_G00123200 [Umbra pygmaea]|uniref:ATP-dependent RNA helicase n=1 Tax=Umbra pygmaea TaxID=75934 RepID=A0ABD0XQL7_UMBPY